MMARTFSDELVDEIRLLFEPGLRDSPNPATGNAQVIVVDAIEVARERSGLTSVQIVFHDSNIGEQRFGARYRYSEEVERTWTPARLATVFSLELEELLDADAHGLPQIERSTADVRWLIDSDSDIAPLD